MKAKIIRGPWTATPQVGSRWKQSKADYKLMQNLFRRSHRDPFYRQTFIAIHRANLREAGS